VPFTRVNHSPSNDKERLDVLKNMHAHAQFCMSGDHTLSGELPILRKFLIFFMIAFHVLFEVKVIHSRHILKK
jgi:hypothetical protein